MDKYQITVNTFDKLATKYQEKYMDFDFYTDTYDYFCELVTTHQAKIFELACGPGNITRYLLRQRPDYRITGTDLSPEMVRLAKDNNPEANFYVLDSRELDSVKEHYDALLCGFCLPYLDKNDVAELLVNAKARLKPSGYIYLSTMEGDDQDSGFQTSSAGDQVYIHYHQAEYICSLLEDNGFNIIKLQRKAFPNEQKAQTTDLFIYAQLTRC